MLSATVTPPATSGSNTVVSGSEFNASTAGPLSLSLHLKNGSVPLDDVSEFRMQTPFGVKCGTLAYPANSTPARVADAGSPKGLVGTF